MALLIDWGIRSTIATCIGALAGAALNYLLQYHWTFAASRSHEKTFTLYVVTVLLSATVNTGIFHLLALVVSGAVATAQITATALVAAMNFIVYKKVVFHERAA